MIEIKTLIGCLAIACTWIYSRDLYHNEQQLESETDELVTKYPALFQKVFVVIAFRNIAKMTQISTSSRQGHPSQKNNKKQIKFSELF